MDSDHFKKLLLTKQRELNSNLAALEREASAPAEGDVKDYTDAATETQGVSESLDVATMLSRRLEEVQSALRRIEDGSFGVCAVCGRRIEAARLEAVPWTDYCLSDQEKRDRGMQAGSPL